MDEDHRGFIKVCGGVVASAALLMLVFLPFVEQRTHSPNSPVELPSITPSADPAPSRVPPAAPIDAPTETPAAFYLPCTSDDSIGIHMEIDLARARGAVSACEWRDVVSKDAATIEVAEPTMSPLYGGVPTVAPGGVGSLVTCGDGTVSHSGGKQGACSSHGGIR